MKEIKNIYFFSEMKLQNILSFKKKDIFNFMYKIFKV